MEFTEHYIEPRHVARPDTVVMYPFPIFGTIQNTGSRLQAMADITGTPVIASDLYLQNKKIIFDMAARQANQPTGETFRSMSQRRADFFAEKAAKRGAGIRIGMGDSLGVSAVQGMQLYGEHTFDALLLRDGWNLDAGTTTLRGIARYINYQLKDFLHQRREPQGFDIPQTPFDDLPAEPDETNIVAKMKNVSDIMKGSHNHDNAVRLAGETDVVMNVVTLQDGLSSGNRIHLKEFSDALRTARAARSPIKKVEGLQAKQYPGWHSDLLDPKRGADDLIRTFQLLKNR